jgi:hypothetical protein
MCNDDFDWRDGPAIVLQEQPATAVYINTYGSIIVLQHMWPDDDVHVMVRPEHAKMLADALINAARLALSGNEAAVPRPRPSATGQERSGELALIANDGGGA